jgi:parallel beta-helix repeat protein
MDATGTQVTNNQFNNQYSHGIFLADQDAPIVTGNTISTNSSSGGFYGIEMGNCDSPLNSTEVSGNSISMTGSGTGIRLSYNDGSAIANAKVANNTISIGISTGYGIYLHYSHYQNLYNNTVKTSGTSSAYGLHVYNSNNVNVYHNTVYITNSSTNGRAIYTSGGAAGTINIQNNIFSNVGTGFAYYFLTTSAIGIIDYNDVITSGVNVARWGSTNYATLADLQPVSGKDANSVSIDPLFVDAGNDDYHLAANSPVLGKGDSISASIIGTTDAEGSLRPNPAGSKPDLGAFESMYDAAQDLTAPANPTGLTAVSQEPAIGLRYTGIRSMIPWQPVSWTWFSNQPPILRTSTWCPGKPIITGSVPVTLPAMKAAFRQVPVP